MIRETTTSGLQQIEPVIIPASGTYVVPAGVRAIRVALWGAGSGGGGGGGGAATGATPGGGGGGGGGNTGDYLYGIFPTVPGETLVITIGSGGLGGIGGPGGNNAVGVAGNEPTDGGATIIAGTLATWTCRGGVGVIVTALRGGRGGTGAAGGAGGATAGYTENTSGSAENLYFQIAVIGNAGASAVTNALGGGGGEGGQGALNRFASAKISAGLVAPVGTNGGIAIQYFPAPDLFDLGLGTIPPIGGNGGNGNGTNDGTAGADAGRANGGGGGGGGGGNVAGGIAGDGGNGGKGGDGLAILYVPA